MQLQKKLTVRTVSSLSVSDIAAAGRKETTDIMSVIGVAVRAQPGQTDLGPYLKFKGNFEAVDLATGTTHNSANLIVPDVLADLIESQLSMEGVERVQFGGILGVTPDDSQIGYRWYYRPVMEETEADPLAALRNTMRAALPAPEKADGKGDDKAKSKDKG